MEPDQSADDGLATEPVWRAFDPRHSLGMRAVLIFGGGAVLFSMLVYSIGGTLLRRELERTLGPSFENLAYQVSDKLDRGLFERTRALQFSASLAVFRTAATSPAELRPALDALLDASPDCVWVGFTDANGKVICAAPNLLEGSDASTTAWFRGGRRQPFIGSPRELPELAREISGFGNDADPRFLDLAVPVTDSNGKFLGVLATQMRWSWARDTQSTVVPETARREHLGVTLYAATGDMMLDSGATGWTDPPPAPRVGERPGVRGSLTEVTPGDTTYLTGYARSRGFNSYRGSGWLVTVRQPAANAFAPVAEFRRQISLFGALLSAAVVILTWIFASYLTRRTKAIATAAGRIGAGDVLSLLPLAHGRDEFQKMCAALGNMVARLRQREETLEADNARLAARLRNQDRLPKS